jgi:hypothetical protein
LIPFVKVRTALKSAQYASSVLHCTSFSFTEISSHIAPGFEQSRRIPPIQATLAVGKARREAGSQERCTHQAKPVRNAHNAPAAFQHF